MAFHTWLIFVDGMGWVGLFQRSALILPSRVTRAGQQPWKLEASDVTRAQQAFRTTIGESDSHPTRRNVADVNGGLHNKSGVKSRPVSAPHRQVHT